jgi:hypothetical protein
VSLVLLAACIYNNHKATAGAASSGTRSILRIGSIGNGKSLSFKDKNYDNANEKRSELTNRDLSDQWF